MQKNKILKIIILAVIFGLGAGVVGQLLTTAYLLPKETFILGDSTRIKKITTQLEEKEKIAEVHKIVAPTVFEIYLEKKSDRNSLGQIYLPKDRIGLGIILTSDGWLASFGRTLADSQNNYIVITSDQKIFAPEKIVLDEATDVVFLKINAQNLPVPKLGKYENLALGEKIILPTNKQSMKITQIENMAYTKYDKPSDLILSSKKFSKLILLKDALNENETGAPLVNLEGEVIGLVSHDSNKAVPIDFWQPAFLSLLKNGQITRPYLGINYLDLSRSPGLADDLTGGLAAGALIWTDKNLKIEGIEKNSPAAQADLKDKDIILKINAEEITAKKGLAEIIQEYSPGDKLEIIILRNGEEKTVEVTLGEKL